MAPQPGLQQSSKLNDRVSSKVRLLQLKPLKCIANHCLILDYYHIFSVT